MGNQFSTDTLCSRDPLGHSYWVDMGRKSFAKGHNRKCYMGYLNGFGPRSGEKVVVKVLKDLVNSPSRWKSEIRKAETTNYFLKAFIEEHPTGERIKVNSPFVALMDTVSILGSHSLHGDELVGIEDLIHGKFHYLNSEDNMVLIDAFSHFTYHHSRGALLIADFRGVEKYGFYHVTNPTIHSDTRIFGDRDGGSPAINEFFKRHRCSEICRGWVKIRPLSPPPCFDAPDYLPPYSDG